MFAKVWHSVLFSVVQVERRWSEPVIPISFMVALQIFPKPGNGRKNKEECIFWIFWEMAPVIPPRMLAPIALNLRNTHSSVSWSSACTNDGDVLLQSCTRGPDIRSIRSFYYLVFFHFDISSYRAEYLEDKHHNFKKIKSCTYFLLNRGNRSAYKTNIW